MKVYHKSYQPHAGQVKMHKSPARFRTGAMGRRWGKTTFGIQELVKEGLKRKGIYWWVAPTYTLSMIAWRKLLGEIPKHLIKNILKSEHMIELINTSMIFFKSADTPERLVGEGLRGLVVDETPRCKQDIWDYNLRPTLSDLLGWAIFIGTPRGHTWFHTMYLRGLDPDYPDYESFHNPSSDNPYLPSGEIDDARTQIPERAFRQEYLAEFIQDGAGVFRGVRDCILEGALVTSVPLNKFNNKDIPRGERFVMGVDLGRIHDYTVISILDSSRELVYYDRFTGINWALQRERIIKASKMFDAQGLVDSTGLGNPVVEELKNHINVRGFVFTNKSKEDLVNSLAINIEEQRIHYPEIPQLIAELEAYDYEVTNSGRYTYNAPTGFNDDTIISIGLANWLSTMSYRLKRYGKEVGDVIY